MARYATIVLFSIILSEIICIQAVAERNHAFAPVLPKFREWLQHRNKAAGISARVCELERQIQRAGVPSFSSYPALEADAEDWRKIENLYLGMVHLLKEGKGPEEGAIRELKMTFGKEIKGPNRYGILYVGSDVPWHDLSDFIQKLPKRDVLLRDTDKIQDLEDTFGEKHGLKFGGAWGALGSKSFEAWAATAEKLLVALSKANVSASALTRVEIGNEIYTGGGYRERTLYVPVGASEEQIGRWLADPPKENTKERIAELMALYVQESNEFVKHQLGHKVTMINANSPETWRSEQRKISAQLKKAHAAERVERKAKDELRARARRLSEALGSDVLVTDFQTSAEETKRVYDLVEKLQKEGLKLKPPIRSIGVSNKYGKGASSQNSLGDCKPFLMISPEASEEDVREFFVKIAS